MIKPFKLLKGYIYSDEYTFPIARRMSGRTIAQDLSNQVQQMVRSPEYIPAGYVSIPIPEPNYDEFVISRVRTKMRRNINWRGYETSIQERNGEVIILKIVSGINIGGMFQILYLITRDGNTERYNVSVPLINLQRRG
jgi:hypothetical protein